MYQATISEIRENMPYEIRMNMFLIQCGEINNALCEQCEDLIELILNRAGDHVFNKMAIDISVQVKQIGDDLGPKNTHSKLLVASEKRLDEVKNTEKKRLEEAYKDLIEWLMMLGHNPRFKMTEDLFKPITVAYTNINSIVYVIEKNDAKIKQERTDIENTLMEQIKIF